MNLNNSESPGVIFAGMLKTLLLSFFCTTLLLPANAQNIRQFNDSCCQSTSKPMYLKKGEKVLISCDTAWLVNAYRMRLYEKAKNYLMNLAGNTDKMAINQAETAVSQLDTYFSEIQSRYFILSEEVKKSQSENKARLQAVNTDLEKVQNALQLTRNDLKDLEKQLKQSRRKEKRSRLLYGGIGAAAGLLLGAVLLH